MLLGLLLTNVHITFGGLTLYQFTQVSALPGRRFWYSADFADWPGTTIWDRRRSKPRRKGTVPWCHGAMLSVPNMENSWIDTKFEIFHDISECVSSMLFDELFFSQKRLKEYKEHTIDSLLLIDPGLTQPSSKRIGPSGSIIMFWRSCWPKHHKPVLVYHTSQMVGV